MSAFEQAFEYIDKSRVDGGGCLVHCNAGVSRSATICIAYIMKTNKLKYLDAYGIVKAAKPDIKPNEGFVVQLKKFEQVLEL